MSFKVMTGRLSLHTQQKWLPDFPWKEENCSSPPSRNGYLICWGREKTAPAHPAEMADPDLSGNGFKGTWIQ